MRSKRHLYNLLTLDPVHLPKHSSTTSCKNAGWLLQTYPLFCFLDWERPSSCQQYLGQNGERFLLEVDHSFFFFSWFSGLFLSVKNWYFFLTKLGFSLVAKGLEYFSNFPSSSYNFCLLGQNFFEDLYFIFTDHSKCVWVDIWLKMS